MALTDTLQNAATNFGPGDLTSLTGKVLGGAFLIGKVLVYIALLFAVALGVYKLVIQFKVKATILKRTGGGGVECVRDQAKIITDEQGKTKLQMFWTKSGKDLATCPKPSDRYKVKIGKRDHYFFWQDDNGHLQPIEPTTTIPTIAYDASGQAIIQEIMAEQSAKLRIRPQERDAWNRLEHQIVLKKYSKQSDFDKYLPSVIMVTVSVLAFLVLYFLFTTIGKEIHFLGEQLGQVASFLAKA